MDLFSCLLICLKMLVSVRLDGVGVRVFSGPDQIPGLATVETPYFLAGGLGTGSILKFFGWMFLQSEVDMLLGPGAVSHV